MRVREGDASRSAPYSVEIFPGSILQNMPFPIYFPVLFTYFFVLNKLITAHSVSTICFLLCVTLLRTSSKSISGNTFASV